MSNHFSFTLELPNELGDRIDCKYHNPKTIKEIRGLNKYQDKDRKLEKLFSGKVAMVSGGKRLPIGHIFLKTDYDNIPYVRATNIKKGKIDIDNTEKINLEVHKKIEKYQLHKGDIAITIVGVNVGKAGILEQDTEICNFNENIAKIAITNENLLNRFIYLFLDSHWGKLQTQRLSVGSMKDKLSLSNIRKMDILIPYNIKINDFDIREQEKIVEAVDIFNNKANQCLNDYRTKIKILRLSVLKKLKIQLPMELGKKIEQTYSYDLSANLGMRLDVLYNNPYRDKLVNEIKKHKYRKLGEIIRIQKMGKILPSDYYRLVELDDISEDLGKVINIKEISKLGSTKVVFRKGEILVSKLQPEKGKIILVDDKTDGCVGSSELIPLKLVSEEVSLEYLWLVLRSEYVLKQWKYIITGSSRERIGKAELENTIIPIPSNKVQNEIINYAQNRASQSNFLLSEFESNRTKARNVFNNLLLK